MEETQPHELPSLWRAIADQWERNAERADSRQHHIFDRGIARTYRRLADELEAALEAGQRRAS